MTRLRRLLVLFYVCLGLVALPMQESAPCCDADRTLSAEIGDAGHAGESCLASLDDDDDCADTCLACCACCPQSVLANVSTAPQLLVPATGDAHGDALARGPPHRDPDEQLQVPRAA